MNYGARFDVVPFADEAMAIVESILEEEKLEWEPAAVKLTTNMKETVVTDHRDSSITWIKANKFAELLPPIIEAVNSRTDWNVDIDGWEAAQYAIYNKGQHYKWHFDSNLDTGETEGIRKITMVLMLSGPDEYEGGEFDLEVDGPIAPVRYKSFRLDKNVALFFRSEAWHRVRPVTSGVRKSLVTWFRGPLYV